MNKTFILASVLLPALLLAARPTLLPAGLGADAVSLDSLYYKWAGYNYLYRGDTACSNPVQGQSMTWQYTNSITCMDPYGDYIFEVYGTNLRRFDMKTGAVVTLPLPLSGYGYYPCGADGQYLYFPVNTTNVVKVRYDGTWVSTTTLSGATFVMQYGFGVARDTVWCLSTSNYMYYGFPCSQFNGGTIVAPGVTIGPVTSSYTSTTIAWDGSCFYTGHMGSSSPVEKWNGDHTLRWTRNPSTTNSRSVMAMSRVRAYDVTAKAIVNPPAYVATLGAQTPRATVRNSGTQAQPASFLVKFRASGPGGNYVDSVLCSPLAAGAETTLSFAPWNITVKGAYAMACSTMSAADSGPSNNKITGSVHAGMMRVLIAHADQSTYPGYLADSLNVYFGNDLFVDTMNVGTYNGNTRYAPSVNYLISNGYRAVLTYANYGYVNSAALGETLAKYMESGGGGVAWAPYGTSYSMGRFTQYYTPNTPGNYYGSGSLGTVHLPSHKVMDGIGSFSFSSYTWNDSLLRHTTAYKVCDYSGGNRMSVACNETLARRSAYLGFFPVAKFYSGASGSWLRLIRNTLLWLGMFDDVGASRIVAPTGIIDSGTAVTPGCTLRNYGTETENYSARMRIGSAYVESVSVTNHAGGTDIYVTFPTWTPVTRGTFQVACSTSLGIDMRANNDKVQGTCFCRVLDVGAQSVSAPTGAYSPGAVVVPRATYRNYGNTASSFEAWMVLYNGSGARVYARKVDINSLPGGTSILVSTFAPCTLATTGSWTARCSTYFAGDVVPANNYIDRAFAVGDADVAVSAIIAPTGSVDSGATIVPRASVINNGSWMVSFDVYFFILDSTRRRIYSNTKPVVGLAGGASANVTFDAWPKPHELGAYSVKCSTYMGGDNTPANDTRTGTFSINVGGSPSSPWSTCSPMPAGLKPVGDGGWIAYEATKSMLYAARGNKQYDFFSYDPTMDSWRALPPIPAGIEAKVPGKGGFGCASGKGLLYALKGNNTQGFYSYDVTLDSWKQLASIPLGTTNKKVKGGDGLAYVTVNDSDYVYCLKGYKNEFWRYDVAHDSWQSMGSAPAAKYNNGSWVALVEQGAPAVKKLYVHEAKNHSFYAYDIATSTWGPALTGMPLVGRLGKTKKAKDGSCATTRPSPATIYSLKGGNTQEFWKYAVSDSGGTWTELDTMPQVGLGSLKKKKVKNGAGIAAVGFDVYALKGNKTNELWQHAASWVAATPSAPRNGVMAKAQAGVARTSITPNPLGGGLAVLSYAIGQAGPASVTIVDVAGRTVLARTLLAGRSGSVNLDLRGLNAGVYVVRFSTAAALGTQKLVVQH